MKDKINYRKKWKDINRMQQYNLIDDCYGQLGIMLISHS